MVSKGVGFPKNGGPPDKDTDLFKVYVGVPVFMEATTFEVESEVRKIVGPVMVSLFLVRLQ